MTKKSGYGRFMLVTEEISLPVFCSIYGKGVLIRSEQTPLRSSAERKSFLMQHCFRRPLFLCSPLTAFRRVHVQAAASVQ